MTDAAVAQIVTGIIMLASMIIGYLKLKNGLEGKIDHNTQLTQAGAAAAVLNAEAATAAALSADAKADLIVDQTNGTMHDMRSLVEKIAERVNKLEDYNREPSHRLFDTVNALGLKVERLLAVQEAKLPSTPTV